MIVTLIPTGKTIEKLAKILGEKSLPHTIKNVRRAANIVMREWIKDVEKSNTKEGFKRRYIDAIHVEPGETALEASVAAEDKFVDFVEKGIKSFDMKPGLLNSPKAKTNKKGQPYMVVSFRFGVPGTQHMATMPRNIYSALQALDSGTPLLQDRIRSIPGFENFNVPGKFSGIVKVGKKGHEQYRNFRVVSQKSKGWIHPGVPAAPVFDDMSQRVTPILKEKIEQGIMKDLEDEASKIK